MFRFVTTDTEIDGVYIPQGPTVWMIFGAVNRDGAETFDPTCENLNDGKGHHFCIRAPLSRLEGRVGFEELLKRVELPRFGAGDTFHYEPSFNYLTVGR